MRYLLLQRRIIRKIENTMPKFGVRSHTPACICRSVFAIAETEERGVPMRTEQTENVRFLITQEIVDAFLLAETENGASADRIRRLRAALTLLREYLALDSVVTKERLLAWREAMDGRGYAPVTVHNYVKCINRFLEFADCPQLRFPKGRRMDITGKKYGYLTALAPTGGKERGELLWQFQCECGNYVVLPATRVVQQNTLSCGCLKGLHLKKTNKYFQGTSLVQSLTEKVENPLSASGYVGVCQKRGKWQAHIKYRGVRYMLGNYEDLEDAIKARAKAKAMVMADAQGLLDFYAEWEKSLPQMPEKNREMNHKVSKVPQVDTGSTAHAKRRDNKSGQTGVSSRGNQWEARIGYQGVRYWLGCFATFEEAVAARQTAQQMLQHDPAGFVEKYGK